MSATRGASQVYCTLPSTVRASVQTAINELFTLSGSQPISLVTTVVANTAYNAFPSVTVAADGALVAAYYTGSLHIASPSSLYSKRGTINDDGSVTWAAAVLIHSDLTADVSTRGVNIATLANGVLLATGWYYDTNLATSIGQGFVCRSTDNGLTWGIPITTGGCTSYVNIQGRPIQLANGRILLPVFGQDISPPILASRIQYSDDNGLTWATLSTILTGSNAIETSLCLLENGHIIATQRNQGDNEIGAQLSTDSGVTWSAYADKFAGASPAAMLQTLTGGVLTVYRSETAPTESQMGFRMTFDEGVTWTTQEQAVTSNTNPGFEYAELVQLDDSIGLIWAAQQSASVSDVFFTKLPNQFGAVGPGVTAQSLTATDGNVSILKGNLAVASAANGTFLIYMPGVTDATGTNGIGIYPHAVSAAFGAGLGAYAAAHATYPGVSFAGTSTGGWFGVYDTADPSGNPRLRVFNGNHAIFGAGNTPNPLGVTNEVTLRAANSSNQVAFNAQGFVIVDGSSPGFYAIWNNGVRTMTIAGQRNGSNSAADFVVSLNDGSNTNERLKVDKNGNVGLGGNVTTKLGVTKESTISATGAGNQVALNVEGNVTSGTNSPGLVNFYNNGNRTASIYAPRDGADGNAGMAFAVSDGGLNVALEFTKTGSATFRNNVRLTPQVFVSLPAAAAGNKGTMACVTDSSTATWGATITGGGANNVMAFSNGTNWKVFAA